jgi:hypothetical protein
VSAAAAGVAGSWFFTMDGQAEKGISAGETVGFFSFFFFVLRGKWEGILNEWSRGRWKDLGSGAIFLKKYCTFFQQFYN